MARRKRNYVNNADFYEALCKYLEECNVEEAKQLAEGVPAEDVLVPVVPTYVAHCIQQIATNLARKPNFSGYSYKDDMIMDAIVNSLKYIRKFDPEKSNNPFAYFSRVAWMSFIARIKLEKREMYIRFKSSQSISIMGETTYDGEMPGGIDSSSTDYMDAFVADFEEKNAIGDYAKPRKKRKAQK